jgi:hypothetical protein
MATVGTKIVDNGQWPLSTIPEQKPLHFRGWIYLHLQVKWGKMGEATTENQFLTEQVNIPKLCTMTVKNKSKS